MTGKNDVEFPFKTNNGQSQEHEVDNYCMKCGGTLDGRTRRCPRCDPAPAIHEEKEPVHPKKESMPVVPPPPPTPPAGRQVQGPVSPPSPKSPPSNVPVKKIAIGLVVLFVVLLLALILIGLLNGSGGNRVLPSVIPLSNTGNTQTSPVHLVTIPTDTVPPNTEVTVQVAKSPITQDISVIFSGGPGQNVLKELEIRVSRSDGQVLTANLVPRQQSEATISGSKGDDRVEVFAVYYSGQKYRIFDEIMKKRVTM